jgi:hypothetical protein
MFNVCEKIANQRLHVRKHIALFALANVPMIALRAFIILALPATSGSAIEQSVLVGMLATLNRLRHPPDHHFQDRTVVEIKPLAL